MSLVSIESETSYFITGLKDDDYFRSWSRIVTRDRLHILDIRKWLRRSYWYSFTCSHIIFGHSFMLAHLGSNDVVARFSVLRFVLRVGNR